MPDWRIEKRLWKAGYRFVAGVDEAGRGPIAGPVFAAAVIFEKPICFKGIIDDSKKLGQKAREKAYEFIKKAAWWAVGYATEEEIEKLNILEATKLAMKRAINSLPVKPSALIIDGNINLGLGIYEKAIIKGDRKSVSIASASIIAKVERDRYMEVLDKKCPGFMFAKHKGYPTPEHKALIQKKGITPYHRKGFKLV